ncbi:Probable hexosyltransferase MUCI70, partial [Linum grandiflorum]
LIYILNQLFVTEIFSKGGTDNYERLTNKLRGEDINGGIEIPITNFMAMKPKSSQSHSPPPFFQSKLLCFSLLYLLTSFSLAFYNSVSSTNCLFRSSPFDPIQSPLFSYPSSYGEHKYALPTHRNSCSSSNLVRFSEYWDVVREIQRPTFDNSSRMRYMNGERESFGGNLSTHERISYFNHSDDETEVPCGFFKEFPVSPSDRIAMESCNGLVVVSAVFNDHDKIRQPKSLGSKTLDSVCFFMFVDETTLAGLENHGVVSSRETQMFVGVWRIVKVDTNGSTLYENPAMNGVVPKYLVHRLFPNSKFSIWVDAKMQLMVDPLLLIQALVVARDVDVAISRHPFFVNTMEEAMATARWKKWWDVEGLRVQIETYCENGLQPWSLKKLPYPSDVPDSAVILRKHGVRSNLFSCLMFNELEAFNPRDQLAFAYVRDGMMPKVKMNMFDVEVLEQISMEYRHVILNKKKKKAAGGRGDQEGTKPDPDAHHGDLLVNSSCCSRCQNYLLEMWGDAHN